MPNKQIDNRKNDYLSDLLQKQMKSAGITDVSVIAEWQEKATKLTPDEFVKEAKSHNGWDVSPLEEYLSASKAEVMVKHAPKKTKASNPVIDAMHSALADESMKGKLGHLVMNIDLPITYEQMKHSVRTCLESVNPHVEIPLEEIVLPFFISKERSLQGRVLSNLDGMKKSVTLMQVYKDQGEFRYQFFGEPKPVDKKTVKPCMIFGALFWVYKFISDDKEEYVILSPNPLELEDCTINGMEANLYDFLKIGNLARLSTTTKVIMVHSQQPSISELDEIGFWGVASRIDTPEKCHEAFFGKYPHPKWFFGFMMSWVFSGKLDKMPTHLSLLSSPSMGKTRMAENFGRVFNQNLNDRGTLRGLIPSFANGIPNEGYLVKAKRFAIVDEFTTLLASATKVGSADSLDGGSSMLLKVLEHSEGEHSSAFGVIKAKPRMWTLFMSNIRTHEHVKNLLDLHGKLNAAFMSRLLWYTYDKEHEDFINTHKDEVMMYGEAEKPPYSDEMCALVDYLHKTTIAIPREKIKAIYEKHKPMVPADLIVDIYDSRMIMHIYRMADGYAKYKSIIERRGALVCTAQDIQDVDDMVGRVVRSWSIGVDESKMPPAIRVTYLNSAQREVFEFVKKNQGCDYYTLQTALGATAANDICLELVRKTLLRQVPTVGGVQCYYTFDAL